METNIAMRILMSTALLALYLLQGDIALAYEEPGYEVVKVFPEFELRQYEAYLVAETSVAGKFSDVGSQAFRRLFAYISEENRPQGKIAMTTPVIQQPDPQAAQATQSFDQNMDSLKRYRFAFVMPATYTLENLPVPENAKVELKEVPARLMAARRYSGTWSERRYRKNQKILVDAINKHGLKVLGEPVFARYNAPFSLWFLRRNEVLIEIQPLSNQ